MLLPHDTGERAPRRGRGLRRWEGSDTERGRLSPTLHAEIEVDTFNILDVSLKIIDIICEQQGSKSVLLAGGRKL